jgi:hypothetical protein
MKTFLEKNFLLIIIILILLLFTQNCTNSRKINRLNKDLITISNSIQNIEDKKLNTLYFEKYLELNTLTYNKNILYDWNSIVRTNVRPDDKMSDYDKMIKNLRDEISKLDK